MSKDIYYFGCWDTSGHYLHDVYGNTGRSQDVKDELPFPWTELDGTFCPGANAEDSKQVEGSAKLTHVEGWTILAFWDRTVDTRGNSHSTYVMRGKHTGEEMLEAIKQNFPGVHARYKFKIAVIK